MPELETPAAPAASPTSSASPEVPTGGGQSDAEIIGLEPDAYATYPDEATEPAAEAVEPTEPTATAEATEELPIASDQPAWWKEVAKTHPNALPELQRLW